MFLDEVQYTRRDWRNRNRIKVARRAAVAHDPGRGQGPVRPADRRDADRRSGPGPSGTSRRCVQAYRRAPHFDADRRTARAALRRARRDRAPERRQRGLRRSDLRSPRDRDAAHAGRPSTRPRDEPSQRLLDLCLAARGGRVRVRPVRAGLPRREALRRGRRSCVVGGLLAATRSTRSSRAPSSTACRSSTCCSTPGRRARDQMSSVGVAGHAVS